MGLFQPILTMAQNGQKLTPWPCLAVPQEGRNEATNPVTFDYEDPTGPMQLCSPRFPGILAPRGRHVGSGCQNWQNRPSWVADQGWLLWRSRHIKP